MSVAPGNGGIESIDTPVAAAGLLAPTSERVLPRPSAPAPSAPRAIPPTARTLARWEVAHVDEARVRRLVDALEISDLAARVLCARGIVDEDRAGRFLAPKLADLPSPQHMRGLDGALARIVGARNRGEAVSVFGDYDVDGLTAAALAGGYFRAAGLTVEVVCAERDRGYGFGPADADAMHGRNVKLAVLFDCGTSDVEGIGRARALGIDVVVVDHHRLPERLPDATALVNPHQPGCGFEEKTLCSAGLAFYLCAALRRRLEGEGRRAPDPRPLLDLAAIGTIADLVPLLGTNRILVAQGLPVIARGERAGLRALVESLALDPSQPIDAQVVSYKMSPRLNAPGRLGRASRTLALLAEGDPARARDLASELALANDERRLVQKQVLVEVEALLAEPGRRQAPFVLVAGEWPSGVVGIVAAKLAELTGRPSAAVALAGGIGRGSARAPQAGAELQALIGSCGEHLVRFGGHSQAAGFTVEESRLPLFQAALCEATRLRGFGEPPPLRIDAEIEAVDLARFGLPEALALARLGPFGYDHPVPLLACGGLVVESAKPVGDGSHLVINFRAGNRRCRAIGFGLYHAVAPEALAAGARVRAAFHPEVDAYRGELRMRLRLRNLILDDGAALGVVGA